MSETVRTQMIGQFVSVTLNGMVEALEANGVSLSVSQQLGRAPSASVRFESVHYQDVVRCPNGGTVTRKFYITGVIEADSLGGEHLTYDGEVTYANCAVYTDQAQTVVVDGAFQVIKNTGRTPTGQQVLRKWGEITWRKLPSNESGRCRSDWNTNYLNPRDPRANATGTFCDITINVPVPAVAPLPRGTPVAGPTPAPNPTPTPGPGPAPTPTPVPGPGPTPTPAPGPSSAAGQWRGTYSTDAVRNSAGVVFCPAGSGTWQATVTVSGSTMTFSWRDGYHGNTTFTVNATVGSDRRVTFSVGSGNDQITLSGTFSADWRSIDGNRKGQSGSLTGPVCTAATGRIPGDWSGNRQ